MGVHVRGTLRDPMGNIMPNTNIRFTSTQGQGEMVAPTFAIYKTNAAGYYSFHVVDGVYYVEVLQLKEYDLDEYEVVGDALVNAGTPSVTTLGDLLEYTTLIPPQDLLNLESFWDGKFTDLFSHFDTITKNLNTALIDGDTRVQDSWTTWTNDTLGARAAERLEITQAETAKVLDLAFAYSDNAGNELAERVSKVETTASSAHTSLQAYKDENGNIGAKIEDAVNVATGSILSTAYIAAKEHSNKLEAVINDTIVVDTASAKQELKLVRSDLGEITANWQVETTVGDITSSIGMVNDGSKSDVYVQANSFHFIDPNSRVYNPFSIIDGTVHMNNVVIGTDDDVPLTSDRQSRALLVDSSTYTEGNTINFTGKTYSTIGYVSVRLKASTNHVSVATQTLPFTAVGLGTAEWSVNPSNVVLTTHPSKANTKWLTASAFGYNKQVTISTTMDGLTDYVNVKLLRPTDGIVGFLNNEKVFYNSRWGWTTLETASTGLFNVFSGTTRVSGSLVTYSIVEETGVTATIDWNGEYKVTSMGSNVDEGYVLFKAEYSGVTILRRLTISKNFGKFTSLTGKWKTIKAVSTGFSLKVNTTSLPSIITNGGDELWHSFEIEIKSGTNSLYLPPMSDGSEITGVVITEGAVGDPENLLSFDGLYPNQSKAQIKSSGYIKDKTGWAIYDNGDCEFNAGTFRGKIIADELILTKSDKTKYENTPVTWDDISGDVPESIDNSKVVVPIFDDSNLFSGQSATDISSSDYNTDTALADRIGWGIHESGEAFFSNAYVKGKIYANEGTLENVTITGTCTVSGKLSVGSARMYLAPVYNEYGQLTLREREAPFVITGFNQVLNADQPNTLGVTLPGLYSPIRPYYAPIVNSYRCAHFKKDVNIEVFVMTNAGLSGKQTTIQLYASYDGGKFAHKYTSTVFGGGNMHIGTIPHMIGYTTKSEPWQTLFLKVVANSPTGGDGGGRPVIVVGKYTIYNQDESSRIADSTFGVFNTSGTTSGGSTTTTTTPTDGGSGGGTREP